MIGPLGIPERAELLGPVPARVLRESGAWLRGELVQTETARVRLRAWAEARGYDAPAPTLGALFKALPCYGDFGICQHIVHAVAELPPPVQAHVLSACSFVGLGLTIWGSHGPPIQFDRSRPSLILVSACGGNAEDIRQTIVHEVAHSWLDPSPVGHPETALELDTKLFYADVPAKHRAWVAEARAAQAAREARVEALTAWLQRGRG